MRSGRGKKQVNKQQQHKELYLAVGKHTDAQLHLTPCDSMYYSPPGSSVHGILLARILEWVAMPSSRGLSQPRDQTRVSCLGRWILYH